MKTLFEVYGFPQGKGGSFSIGSTENYPLGGFQFLLVIDSDIKAKFVEINSLFWLP